MSKNLTDKNCYLNDEGLEVIENILKALKGLNKAYKKCFWKSKKFPYNVNRNQLHLTIGKDRATLKKVLLRTEPVNCQTLKDIFANLENLLKEEIKSQEESNIRVPEELKQYTYIQHKVNDYVERREDQKTIAATKKSSEAIATSDRVFFWPVSDIPCFIRNR